MSDRAEVRAKLAEKFVLPGRQYPLRRVIDEQGRDHEECLDSDNNLAYPSCTYIKSNIPNPLLDCSGLGYVFNDAPDAVTEAIWEKGWQYRQEGHHKTANVGDSVLIMNSIAHDIARVSMNEGHQGQAALELVALRALEAE